MVFGNAELRIQNNTNVVTSNLGSTFKFFNTKDLKDPTVLFGSEKREAILACYEVFQI